MTMTRKRPKPNRWRRVCPCQLRVRKSNEKYSVFPPTYKKPAGNSAGRFFSSEAPRVGLEPTTPRLTAVCSTIELSRIIWHKFFPYTFKTIYCQSIFKTFFLSYDALQSAFAFFAFWSSPRPISNSQLHTLPCFHLCPIYLVVFKGSYFFRMGYLILRGASRLDAFSVYPVPTWLPGGASGDAAGTPAVSPSRSSRTKDSSSQISCAHAG